MSHIEITTESWLTRLTKSIASVAGGFVLFFIALIVLFFNEGRAVQTEKSLNEGAGAVKTVPSDTVDAKFDKKLVHLTGDAKTAEKPADPDFKVATNAIRLDRKVEMYQWRENKHTTERKLSNGSVQKITSYDYDKSWTDHPIDSESFSESAVHENPSMPYRADHWTASNVTFGAFTLSPALIEKLDAHEDFAVSQSDVKALPKAMHAKLDGSSFYLGNDPTSPRIGDVRVSYSIVKPSAASIVAVQSGASFIPWPAPSGDEVLLLQTGTHTAPEMFATAQSNNSALTMFLRFLGWAMLFAGLRMFFKPLAVVSDIIPFVGSMLGAGVTLFAFVTASSLAILTIGLSWLFFRPVMGILLIALSGGVLYFMSRRAKKKAAGALAKKGITLQHTVIERQDPAVASLPIKDSVIKGTFQVQANETSQVLSMKAQLCVDVKRPNGKVESIVLGEDVFPEKYTSRSAEMVQYPFTLKAGEPVKDFFSIHLRDVKTNTSRSIEDELQRRGVTADQASFFITTSLKVQGLSAQPQTRTAINVVS